MVPIIGVDVRPRLAIGEMAMHFLIVGAHLCVVKEPIDESDPTWLQLVRAGFRVLPFLPMVTAELV